MQFDQLYGLAIDKAERAVMPGKRIDNIIERLTYDVYIYFQRGLFERHKTVFAPMLAFAILVAAGKVCICNRLDIWASGIVCSLVSAQHIQSLRRLSRLLHTIK